MTFIIMWNERRFPFQVSLFTYLNICTFFWPVILAFCFLQTMQFTFITQIFLSKPFYHWLMKYPPQLWLYYQTCYLNITQILISLAISYQLIRLPESTHSSFKFYSSLFPYGLVIQGKIYIICLTPGCQLKVYGYLSFEHSTEIWVLCIT